MVGTLWVAAKETAPRHEERLGNDFRAPQDSLKEKNKGSYSPFNPFSNGLLSCG
jgi:hypothetical protein